MTKELAIENDFENNTSSEGLRRRQNTGSTSIGFKTMEDLNEISTDGRETEYVCFAVGECEHRSIPKEQETTHYAQIITNTTFSSPARKLSTRKTRESDHPILRDPKDTDTSRTSETEDNGQPILAQDDFALYENARSGKTVREYSRENSLNEEREIHCSRSDSELAYENVDAENVYQNTDPEIIYQNTSGDFNTSHIYENFEGRTTSCELKSSLSIKSTTSNEASETESLYEDLDIVYEEMSSPLQQRATSKPIDIVYTSIDFGARKTDPSPVSVGSCTNSSSLGSLERPELRRCTSYCYGNAPFGVGKPPELPQRGSGSFTRRSRPRSLHLGNPEGTQTTDYGLGLYTGTLVGSCIVAKTSPKSIQKIIGDYLAREKREHSKPVSFQVTSEFLCLSYNCAPWWLLAKNSVDDIGCITTYSANNRTALGYTISKPGEDTRLFVIHCSDADQIKETIVKNFKRPAFTNSLSKWGSMGVLSTQRSGYSASLPRMSTTRTRRKTELESFDDLVYLGSHKVKKSFLVVNDNISSVLDHSDSKDYTIAKIELYKDAIHLKNSKQDRILDIHQLEWILSMGLFDEDRRYFGYISSKAFQGSKTRTTCHVFRCNRVGLASQVMETIRQACQATYLARRGDYQPDFRPRTNSSTSTSSEGSISSNSETTSIGSTSSSPVEVGWSQTLPARMRKRPGRYLAKRLSKAMSTIQSLTEESNDTGIDTLGEETPEMTCAKEKAPHTKQSVPEKVPQPQEELNRPYEKTPQTPEEKPPSEKCTLEVKSHPARRVPDEKPRPEIGKESWEKRFNVFYLVSTIVSPPLKPKHVKECLKQYQKTVDKAMKKGKDSGQHYKKAQLVFSPRGVMVMDDQTQTPQAFYERTIISGVQSHPDGKCAFAFTTVVSGNTKHKCHLFLQDKEPIGAIIKEMQTYIS